MLRVPRGGTRNNGRWMDSRDLFEILVRENADSVRAFLLSSVRDAASAEDLLQDTFLTAWKNLDRYDRQLPFGPWVRGIAGKLLLNWRRKMGRSKLYFCDEEALGVLDQKFEEFQAFPGDTFDDKVDVLRGCMVALGAKPAAGDRAALRARLALRRDRAAARHGNRGGEEAPATRPRHVAALHARQGRAGGAEGRTRMNRDETLSDEPLELPDDAAGRDELLDQKIRARLAARDAHRRRGRIAKVGCTRCWTGSRVLLSALGSVGWRSPRSSWYRWPTALWLGWRDAPPRASRRWCSARLEDLSRPVDRRYGIEVSFLAARPRHGPPRVRADRARAQAILC